MMRMTRRQALAFSGMAVLPNVMPALPGGAAESDAIERTDLAAKNAETIRRHHAALNAGDVTAAARFFAEDTRNHGVPVGRKGVTVVLTDIYSTFPDFRMEIEDLAAIGDDVVVRAIVTGTHKGVGKLPVNGGLLVGVPATGKSFKVQHIHWYTLKSDLIVEHRACRDDIGMMQEMGLLPAVQRYDLPRK